MGLYNGKAFIFFLYLQRVGFYFIKALDSMQNIAADALDSQTVNSIDKNIYNQIAEEIFLQE